MIIEVNVQISDPLPGLSEIRLFPVLSTFYVTIIHRTEGRWYCFLRLKCPKKGHLLTPCDDHLAAFPEVLARTFLPFYDLGAASPLTTLKESVLQKG